MLHRLIDVLPGRYRLALRYRLYRYTDNNEPELTHLHRVTGWERGMTKGIAIDVGANHGYYSYRMLHLFEQVLAFEINPEAGFDLFEFNHPRLVVFPYGLSDKEGTAELYIPLQRQNQKPLLGWASLEQRAVPGAGNNQQTTVSVRTLDAVLSGGPFQGKIRLIKVDVEGHEYAVIRGAWQTIVEHMPVLIVETAGEAMAKLIQLLEPIGYRMEKMAQTSPNVLFLPKNTRENPPDLRPIPAGY